MAFPLTLPPLPRPDIFADEDVKRSEKPTVLIIRYKKRKSIRKPAQLLGASVFGDSLGALRYSVLSQLSRQKETDSSLDLSGSNGRPRFEHHKWHRLETLTSCCSGPAY